VGPSPTPQGTASVIPSSPSVAAVQPSPSAAANPSSLPSTAGNASPVAVGTTQDDGLSIGGGSGEGGA
ncbi:MAG: serine/threonine protein kinase, partial [Candidatus Micrarchaeia archaeon]